jgi:polysaccharide deacetylase family protein (PEP-CTERM system associated)
MLNAFTVDLEDYFHPSEVGTHLSSSDWSSLPSRVEVGTAYLLDLLAKCKVRATFFILGWVASKHPDLVRRVAEAGHEIACHSHEHRLVYELSPSEFKTDTMAAVRAIRDACGVTPTTYRAPSFSITENSLWALEILVECGFTHDSSICPIVHDRYGIPGSPRQAHTVQTPSGPIVEIPVATVELPGKRIAPIGGGGYLRLFPYRYTAAGIRRLNNMEAVPACIYVHPWELDPDQPRLASGSIARMRTYIGLSGMGTKLTRLLQEFRFSSIREVYSDIGPGQTFGMAYAKAAGL